MRKRSAFGVTGLALALALIWTTTALGLTVPERELHAVLVAGAALLSMSLATVVAVRRRMLRSQLLAERAVRESEARFRLLAENSTDMITRHSVASGLVLYASPASVRMLGRAPAELVGTSLLGLVHPDDLTVLEAAAPAVLDPYAAWSAATPLTVRFLHRDGRWLWLESSVRVLHDASGNPLEIHASSRDVTERYENSQALIAEQELTRSILATASDAFVATDQYGVVVDWNARATALFGWDADEVVGKELVDLLVPERSRDAHRRALLRGLDDPAETVNGRLELVAVHRDGHEIPVDVAIWQMKLPGGIRYNAFLRDITERKEIEASLAAARDQALDASRLKSRFLATMSHEIRTPMNGVIGLTNLLLDGELDATQRRYGEGIRLAGEALLGLINDVLDFSRIEAGKVVLDTVDFDPRRVVDDVVSLVGESARGKGLVLRVEFDAEVPSVLSGDPGRLRQVLLNLAANAVKFTDEGEVAITIEAACVDAGTPIAERVALHIEVSDTGIGMSPDTITRLFQPFSQADESTTRRYGGSGLGLAISRELADAMGGSLEVRSAVGAGSTFRCVLPFAVPAASDSDSGTEAAPADASRLRGIRAVLLDEDATSRLVMAHQLRLWGMVADIVDSPETLADAVCAEAGRGRPYDVALVNLDSPNLDAFAVAETVGRHGDLSAAGFPGVDRPGVHVILVTSDPTVADSIASRAPRGVSATLVVPVRQAELFDCLVRVAVPGVSAPPPSLPLITRGRVLLVEDNEINQLVALGMLRHLGFEADLACNGVEAVAKGVSSSYDAVLMDCQMPLMDGYMATVELRREGVTVPIIAMTASALPEDRERCLASGMDDYVSKPVSSAALAGVLARWKDGVSAAVPEPVASVSAPAVLDESRLSELRDPEPDEFTELMETLSASFARRAPGYLDGLADSIQAGDASAVEQQAHSLKGVAANLGVARLAAVAAQLEAAGRGGELSAAPDLLARLRVEYTEAQRALDDVLASF